MENCTQIVDITIKNSIYKVACNECEKQHLLELSKKFENLVLSLSDSSKGKYNDSLVFLLAGLTLENEIEELKTELQKVTDEMLKYKSYFHCYLQNNEIMNKVVSYSLSRIEKLIQHLKRNI